MRQFQTEMVLHQEIADKHIDFVIQLENELKTTK